MLFCARAAPSLIEHGSRVNAVAIGVLAFGIVDPLFRVNCMDREIQAGDLKLPGALVQ